MRRIWTLALALCLSGCGYTYTQSTAARAAAKPANCDFDILTARPEEPFDELGVLDCESAGYAPGSLSGFRSSIQSKVCVAGGDAVLAEVNGMGKYVRGTVIRYRAK
jgi:hypothetical protein